MGEKRKLHGRELVAKRRAAEPAPQQPHSSRRKVSGPVVAPAEPSPAPSEHVQKPLLLKIKDGEGLPVTSTPQPADLSTEEYQSIPERYGCSSASCYNICADSSHLFVKCSTSRLLRAIETEMAKRWDLGAVLDETEEVKKGTDRGKEPAQGVHVQGRLLQYCHWPSYLRCYAVHCEGSQGADILPSAEADDPLWASRQ